MFGRFIQPSKENAMKRAARVGPILFVVLAFVASACAKSTPRGGGTPTPTVSPTPEVSIGQCETKQGTQAPTTPKGVDYKTQLKEQGVLNVGSDNDFPPFEEIKPGAKAPDRWSPRPIAAATATRSCSIARSSPVSAS